jgi:uncharacterized protein (TIGR02118 family)
MIALFLLFEQQTGPVMPLNAGEVDRFISVLRSTHDLAKALIHTPEITSDPFLKGEAPPLLVAQLYFLEIDALEKAANRTGPLQALASANDFPSLSATQATQQAMVARIFSATGARSTPSACTYLVGYEGPAERTEVWLSHYLESHVPLMTRLPGVREIEVYTRLDWCGFLPWRRVEYMQRNKVVFDDATALAAALNSPIRREMRACYESFPPFSGRTPHHAFATRTVIETPRFRLA